MNQVSAETRGVGGRACACSPLPPLRCSAGAAAGRLRRAPRGRGCARSDPATGCVSTSPATGEALSSAPFPEALDRLAPRPRPPAPRPGPEGTPTNVQEAGVDEPDIVKSAGSTLFTVDGNVLRAVDTSGGAPVLSGSIELPRGPANARVGDYQLLVAGDRLLAIGSAYGYAIAIEGDVDRPGRRLSRSAADPARRGRHLRPGGDGRLAHDGLRRLLRQRPAHRLDRSPRELRLPVRRVRGVRPRPRPGAEDDGPRPGERRAAARQARRLRRRAPAGAVRRRGDALGADDRPPAGPARRRRRRRAHRRPDRLRVADGALRRHRALGHRAPGPRARRCAPRSTASTPPTPRRPSTSPAARSQGTC